MSDKNFKVKNGIDANGAVTITQPSTSTVPLTILANTLATGSNLFEVKRPDGSVRLSIGNDGALGAQNLSALNVRFYSANSGSWPLVLRGQASQTADLQQWRDVNENVLASVSAAGSISAVDLTLSGNLTVNGTTTNLNSTNLIIEDKNIIIADVATPTDTTADGAGITIKGATDKTFSWVQSSGRFVSSEPVQSSAFIGTSNIYTPQLGSTVIGSATLNTNADTGGILINTAGASNKGFIVKGAASQTANLQEWQNSGGTVLASVDASGNIYTSSTTIWAGYNRAADGAALYNFTTVAGATYAQAAITRQSGFNGNLVIGQQGTGAVLVQNGSASAIGLIVKGTASQTANLQEWQNSAGDTLGFVDSDGKAYFSHSSTNTNLFGVHGNLRLRNRNNTTNNYSSIDAQSASGVISSGILFINSDHTNSYGRIVFGTRSAAGFNSNAFAINSSGGISTTLMSASSVGLIVKAAASQSANLQEWQNSAGTVLAKVNSYGGAEFVDLKINTTSSLGSLGIVTGTTTQKGIVVRGIASQTANLQEWQDSAGSVLSSITYFGGARLYDLGIKGGPEGIGWAYFGNDNTSTKNVVVRAFASQTANLTEWQDSAGTALATVSSFGSFTVNNLGVGGTLGATVRFIVTSSGAGNVVSMFRGAASQTADLQQWQNSSATVLASISSAGKLTSAVDASINGVVIGRGSGSFSTNTVTGLDALVSNTTGTYNTAFGHESLKLNTSGTQNTAFGQGALYNNRNGWYNTAFGQGALQQNNYAYSNTAIGANAMITNVSGSANTALGIQSLLLNLSGNNNIGLGANAGFSNSTGSGNIFLGYESGYYETGSNKLYIANSNTATPLIGGDFSAKTLTFAGNATVVSQAAATQGLIIKGAASQTANLQEWQNSDGTVLSNVDANGKIAAPIFQSTVAGTAYIVTGSNNNAIRVQTNGTTNVGLIIRGETSQTADLQQWQNSAGSVTAKVSSSGAISSSAGGFFGSTDAAASGVNYLAVRGWAADHVPFAVKGFTAQTGDLTRWINDAGTVLAKVVSDGVIYAPTIAISSFISDQAASRPYIDFTTANKLIVQTRNAGYVGLTIKGAASQTANLQEWQDSSGTVLTRIDANGLISLPGGSWHLLGGFETWYKNSTSFYQKGASHTFRRQSDDTDLFTIGGNGNTSVLLQSASAVGLIVKSAASQTADLQQWQNSSGTVVARVESSGALNVSPVAAPNGYSIYVIGSGSSGIVTMKSTATSAHAIQLQNSANTIVFKMDQEGRIVPAATTSVGLTVRGITSQTANLQEWQNSAGTVLTRIASDGSIYRGATTIDSYGAIYTTETMAIGANAEQRFASGGMTIINRESASAVIFGVKGISSQTGDLTQWRNSSDNILAKIDANGNFSAITKSFDIPHPTKENMRLRYASLEGPENGVYIRGTTKSNIIELPDYWTGLVHEDSITVSLTAVGSAQNIYVEKIENNKVYIGGELTKAFFTVYGERKDIDNLVVEY